MSLTRKSPLARIKPLSGILRTAQLPEQKMRRCKAPGCRELFRPAQPWITWHSPECGTQIALLKLARIKAAKAKLERKKDRARKEGLKTKSDYAAEAQAEVNRYVNLRDQDKPCISCGKSAYKGVRNASHYKSRGSNSALRFNLWNINSSCYKCNVELSGNIGEYRPRLMARIGADKVEWLDHHPRSREYSKEYLVRIKRVFAKKAKRLAKSKKLERAA